MNPRSFQELPPELQGYARPITFGDVELEEETTPIQQKGIVEPPLQDGVVYGLNELPSELRKVAKLVNIANPPETSASRKAQLALEHGTSGLLGLPGNIQALLQMGSWWALNKIGSVFGLEEKPMPSREELAEMYSQAREYALYDEPAGVNSLLPTSADIRNIIDEEVFGELGYSEPRTTGERITSRISEFAGAGAPFGALGTLPGILGTVGGGTGVAVAEEAGFGPGGQFAAGVIGDIAGRQATNLARNLPKLARNPIKGPIAYAISPSESQLMQNVSQAAQRAGIKLPLSAQTDSGLIRHIEAQLAQSGLSGEAYKKFSRQLSKNYINGFKNALEEIGPALEGTIADKGAVIQDSIGSAQAAAEATKRQLYKNFTDKVDVTQQVSLPRLAKRLDDTVKKLSKTIKASPERADTIKELEGLRDSLFDQNGQLKPFDLESLVNAKIDLNDIIDFHAQGGTKQFLKGALADVNHEIDRFASVNEQAVAALREADGYFADMAEVFRNNPSMKKALFDPNPENVLKIGNKVSDIRNFKKAVSYLPEEQAAEAWNNFRRTKLEELVTDKFLSPQERSARFRTASKALDNKLTKDLIKELAAENYPKLEDLSTIADGIDKGGEFLNPSRSYANLADISLGMYIVKSAAKGVLTGDPTDLVKAGMAWMAPKMLAKLMTNPDFVELTLEMSRAGTQGQPALYQAAAARMSPIISRTVSELEEERKNR